MRRVPPLACRAVALAIGLWLVLGGALGARHEARAAHFVDAHSGAVVHGSRMAGVHTTTESDIHTSDAAADHDACSIATALHQPGAPAVRANLQLAVRSRTRFSHARLREAHPRAAALFRIAPKTSPPRAR